VIFTLASGISSLVMMAVCYPIGWALVCLLFADPGELDNAKRIYALSFSVSLLTLVASLAFYHTINGTMYPSGFSDDDYTFDSDAIKLLNYGIVSHSDSVQFVSDLGSGIFHNASYYTIFVFRIYQLLQLFGLPPNPVVPRIVNLTFFSLTIVIIYKTARMITNGDVARRASLITLFSPFMLVIAVNTYRDILICFGITAVLQFFVWCYTNKQVAPLPSKGDAVSIVALMIAGAVIVSFLRLGYFMTLPLILYCVFFLRMKLERRHRAFVLLLLLAVALALGFGYASVLIGLNANALRAMSEYNVGRITGGGSSQILTYVYALPDAVTYVVLPIVRNYTPIPIPSFDTLSIETFYQVGTIVWLSFLPKLFVATRTAMSERQWNASGDLRVVFVFFAIFFLLSALGTMQARHTTTYIPAASILMAASVTMEKTKLDSLFRMVIQASIVALLAYGVLRVV